MMAWNGVRMGPYPKKVKAKSSGRKINDSDSEEVIDEYEQELDEILQKLYLAFD